jgi:hypothetical protein
LLAQLDIQDRQWGGAIISKFSRKIRQSLALSCFLLSPAFDLNNVEHR